MDTDYHEIAEVAIYAIEVSRKLTRSNERELVQVRAQVKMQRDQISELQQINQALNRENQKMKEALA